MTITLPDEVREVLTQAGVLTYYPRPAVGGLPSVIVYGTTGTSETLAAVVERILNAIGVNDDGA